LFKVFGPVLASIFGFLWLAWHAPGEAANPGKNIYNQLVFVGHKAFARFSQAPQRARDVEQRRAGNS